ncbi:MAG: hypothetical protein HY939_07755 [Gammaproteobacteria bacterium]|nr:hypothetical protein [Gammaproteobacteria bacterium]
MFRRPTTPKITIPPADDKSHKPLTGGEFKDVNATQVPTAVANSSATSPSRVPTTTFGNSQAKNSERKSKQYGALSQDSDSDNESSSTPTQRRNKGGHGPVSQADVKVRSNNGIGDLRLSRPSKRGCGLL